MKHLALIALALVLMGCNYTSDPNTRDIVSVSCENWKRPKVVRYADYSFGTIRITFLNGDRLVYGPAVKCGICKGKCN